MNEIERQRIETALDRLYEIASENCTEQTLVEVTTLYGKAVAIVRERPAGHRRVRSDFQAKRQGPQMALVG